MPPPFRTLRAVAVPLDRANVDTDQIIPARFLGRARPAQAAALFHDLRHDPGGARLADFVLDQPAYAGARILVADRNFGCGSSRENAVTALVDNGFMAFIAPSFGDIFFNNCFQNGALPIVLEAARVDALRALLRADPGAMVEVNLADQTVTAPDGSIDRFALDPFRKRCLLEGLDDIGLTLAHRAEIEAFEARRRASSPWL